MGALAFCHSTLKQNLRSPAMFGIEKSALCRDIAYMIFQVIGEHFLFLRNADNSDAICVQLSQFNMATTCTTEMYQCVFFHKK
jgi:hypothetical protein